MGLDFLLEGGAVLLEGLIRHPIIVGGAISVIVAGVIVANNYNDWKAPERAVELYQAVLTEPREFSYIDGRSDEEERATISANVQEKALVLEFDFHDALRNNLPLVGDYIAKENFRRIIDYEPFGLGENDLFVRESRSLRTGEVTLTEETRYGEMNENTQQTFTREYYRLIRNAHSDLDL